MQGTFEGSPGYSFLEDNPVVKKLASYITEFNSQKSNDEVPNDQKTQEEKEPATITEEMKLMMEGKM